MADRPSPSLLKRVAGIFPAAATARVASKVHRLIELLVASEEIATAAIATARGSSHPASPRGGQAQLAFMVYWICHKPVRFQSAREAALQAAPATVRKLWKVIEDEIRANHRSGIRKPDYLFAQRQPCLVAPDGTIIGIGCYEDMDPGWIEAAVNWLWNVIDPDRIAPFRPDDGGAVPYQGPLRGSAGTVRIALLGDWGTGSFDAGGYNPALDVLQTIQSLKPDYLIHLGDVYYAGTAGASGEEHDNFLKWWPNMPAERSFMLNSNHEMYGAADGYFNVALGRGRLSATPFGHQNGFSYFALTDGTLAVVGLDAAYFDPSTMYLRGGLGSRARDPQYGFLQQISDRSERLILLTHQAPMSLDGARLQKLWTDVASVVVPTSRITHWYWGHEHAGIVYGKESAIGRKGVCAGCAGHGAIPIGLPPDPSPPSKLVAWRAHTAVGGHAPPCRVRNGFAILTISAGKVREAFYDAGKLDPAYVRDCV
jgi:hypothetical protein